MTTKNTEKKEITSAKDEPLRLEIDSHVVRQLGDELITDTGQALLELVKNSYDADADWCKVNVDTRHVETIRVNLPPSAPRKPDDDDSDEEYEPREVALHGMLSVADNGDGMTQEAIRKGWLMISLSPKRAFKAAGKQTTNHHRTPVGDKGLGRLGTVKLGNYVVIETFTDPKKSGYRISFSWSECISGQPLSRVPVQEESLPANGSKGTRLLVYGLSDLDYWRDKKAHERLENQLSTLISPFVKMEGFAVDFHVDAVPLRTQRAEEYLQAAQSRFAMTWDSSVKKDSEEGPPLEIEGHFKLSLFKTARNDDFYDNYVAQDNGKDLASYIFGKKKTKAWKFKRGTNGFFLTFKEQTPRRDLLHVVQERHIADPGPLMGEIYAFDFDESREVYEALDKAGKAPAFTKEQMGVFVFRDKFRIRMGDDWLRLGDSWTKGSSYYGLKPKNTLGWIAVTSKDNAQLVEKSDREGFVDNSAKRGFDQLTAIFRDRANDSLEVLRRTYLEYKKERLNENNKRPRSYSSAQALNEVRTTAKSAGALTEQVEAQKKVTLALRAATGDLVKIANQIPETSATKNSVMAASAQIEEMGDQLEDAVKNAAATLSKLADLQHAADTIAAKLEQNDEQFKELYGMAAVGLAAQGLIHELQPCIDEMLYAVDRIKSLFRLMEIRNPRLFEIIELTQTSARSIGDRVRFLDPMLRAFRSKREVLDLEKFLNEFKAYKDSVLVNSKIKIDLVRTGETIQARVNRGQITQIFDNLFRNSEYWLANFAKEHPKEPNTIKIEIESPFVRISDTGFGVPEKVEEILFDLFVTTKPKGEGHGLGLYLARELAHENSCEISLCPDRNKYRQRYIFQVDFTGALHG